MNNPQPTTYLAVAPASLVLAVALAGAGPALPGHPQAANPAWPDAMFP